MDLNSKMIDIPDLKFTAELNDIVKKADKNLKSEVSKVNEKRRSQLIVIGSSSESMKSCDFGSATLSSISNSGHGNSSNYCTEDSACTNQELNKSMIEDVEISLANISEELLCISSNSSNCAQSKKISRNILHKEAGVDVKLTSLDKKHKDNLENTFSSSFSEGLLSLNAKKVMEALEIENMKLEPTLFTDINRTPVLDLEMLNDCLTSSSLKVSSLNSKRTSPVVGGSSSSIMREDGQTPSQIKAASRLAFIRKQLEKTLSEEHRSLTCLEKSINFNVSSSFNEEFLILNSNKVIEALENDYLAANTTTSFEGNKTTALDLEILDDSLINGPLKESSSNADISEKMIQIMQQLLTPKFNKEVTDKLNYNIDQFLSDSPDQTNKLKLSPIYNAEAPQKCENTTFDHKDSENHPKQLAKTNFNSTFDKDVIKIGDKKLLLNSTFDRIESNNNSKLGLQTKNLPDDTFLKETAPVNTTFGFDEIISSKGNRLQNLNETFEKVDKNENLDGTFEVVGNGKFVIEGKVTNLIDMESSALQTVLHCTPIQGTTEGETPINRRKSLSIVKKKPTFMNRLSMAAVSTSAGNEESVGTTELVIAGGVECGADFDSNQQQTQPSQDLNQILPLKGPFGREEILNKLQKNTKLVSGTTGPVKAVPIKVINAVERLGRRSVRAVSTPVAGKKNIKTANHQTGESVTSEINERKFPSLPSFGSVSSIDPYDAPSDGSLGTPEVFRFRSCKEPAITSTPAMKAEIKFSMIPGNLCGNNVPTPIIAPKDQSSFPYSQGSRVIPITGRNIIHENDSLGRETGGIAEDEIQDKSDIICNSKLHLLDGDALHNNKEPGIQILGSDNIKDMDNELKNFEEVLEPKESASIVIADDKLKLQFENIPKSMLQEPVIERTSGNNNALVLGQNFNETTVVSDPENCFTDLKHINNKSDVRHEPYSEAYCEFTQNKRDFATDIENDKCERDAHCLKTNVICKPIAEESNELENINKHSGDKVTQEATSNEDKHLHDSQAGKEETCEFVGDKVVEHESKKTTMNSDACKVTVTKFSKNNEVTQPVEDNVADGKLTTMKIPSICKVSGSRRSSLNNNVSSKTGIRTNQATKLVSIPKPSLKFGQQFRPKESFTKPPLNPQSKIVHGLKNKVSSSENLKSSIVPTIKVKEKTITSRRSTNELRLQSKETPSSLKPVPLLPKAQEIPNLTKQTTNVLKDTVLGNKAGSQLMKRPSGLKIPSKLALPLSSNISARRSSLQHSTKPFNSVSSTNIEEQNNRKIATSSKENVQPITKLNPRRSQIPFTNIPRPNFR